MTMKQINNFNQSVLKPHCIYLLDFDSEVFIWFGSDVSSKNIVASFLYVGRAIRGVHSKGKNRRDKIACSITYQGFEPEIFKSAFGEWSPFQRKGLDTDQISDESDEDGSSNDSANVDDGATDSTKVTVGSLNSKNAAH